MDTIVIGRERNRIRLRVSGWALLLVAACTSCSAHREFDRANAGGTRRAESTDLMDLISPSRCTLRGTHLVSCAIPAQTFAFPGFDTAVPMRTTVSAQRSGNCSTQYPLQVMLRTDSEPPVNFPYIAGGAAVVRRKDGGLMSSLTVADSSSWTSSASFDQSCRIALNISSNEIDVDTKAQAQAIVDNLKSDLASKQATAARDRELLLYSKAFAFLKAVADNFLGQLTDDSLQDLRSSSQDAQPALEQVITDCNSLTQDQKLSVYRLNVALGKLDHPEDWQNPDGSKKTLRDFLGPDDQKVIDTINQLAQGSAPDAGTVDYDMLYQQAAIDVANAQKKLALAEQQLAPWLN